MTVEEIASGSGSRSRHFGPISPAKENVFRAHPHRVAQQLADLMRDRPRSETRSKRWRNAFCEPQLDSAEHQRWVAAYANSDTTTASLATPRVETMAAGFSEATAARSGAARDDVWVEMAGWMSASAMGFGARHVTTNGGALLDHVLASWGIAGNGIRDIRS